MITFNIVNQSNNCLKACYNAAIMDLDQKKYHICKGTCLQIKDEKMAFFEEINSYCSLFTKMIISCCLLSICTAANSFANAVTFYNFAKSSHYNERDKTNFKNLCIKNVKRGLFYTTIAVICVFSAIELTLNRKFFLNYK